MAGRRGSLGIRTPERREAFIRALRSGSSRRDAAGYADMSHDTMDRWLRSDASFRAEVEAAEAFVAVGLSAVVYDAARGRPAQYDDRGRMIREEVKPDARMALRWLERHRREEWGRTMRIDVRAIVNRYAEANGMDPERLIAEAEAIAREAWEART